MTKDSERFYSPTRAQHPIAYNYKMPPATADQTVRINS